MRAVVVALVLVWLCEAQFQPFSGPFADNLAQLNNHLTMRLTQQQVHTLMPERQLPANTSILAYTRVYRIIGQGLLPLPAHLLQLHGHLMASICKRLRCSCRAFHLHLHAPTLELGFEELIQQKDEDSEKLCQRQCMVQMHPVLEPLSTCPACSIVQPETGLERYGQSLSVLQVSVTRDSFMPMVLRTLWNATTLEAYIALAGSDASLPQLHTHIIHHVHLAQHAPRWHNVQAVSLALQLWGPNVAPMTVGKTSLILHVLNELEGESPDLDQYFRLEGAKHDVALQQAWLTVIIVHSSLPTVSSLDKILVADPGELQRRLTAAGLKLTGLEINVQPYRGETVPDQIAAKLTFWRKHAKRLVPALWSVLAIVVVAGIWRHRSVRSLGEGAGHLNSGTTSTSSNSSLSLEGWSSNAEFLESMASKYAKRLHVSMCMGPCIESTRLEVCRRSDDSPWLLGQGACGLVYKGVRDNAQDVALKVLAVSNPDASLWRSFSKEIGMLRALSFHGNVVQLYGVCMDTQHPMLVFEYMAGGDLFSHLQSTWQGQGQGSSGSPAFSWYTKGGSIAKDIARGLIYLHDQQVVHNDIKSKNILLSKGGEVAKIADLGTAFFLGVTEGTTSAPLMGTFVYAAPEQLLGTRSTCTDKVDMYSFGVVLWEIATRQVPHRGCLRDTQVPEECPQDIEDLITACLSTDPAGRPTAREALQIITKSLQ